MKLKEPLLLFLLIMLLIPNGGYGATNNPKVYLIVMNKITLEDIKSMDNVQAIIEEGSIGLMNTRGTSGYAGAESFLTINASRKAYANDSSIEFFESEIGESIQNHSLSKIINLNQSNKYTPYIGAIGDNLHMQGLKTAIYGNSNLIDEDRNTTALIPMDSKGLIDYGNIKDITLEEKNYPFNIKTDYPKLLEEVKNSPGDLVVVDTGDLERIYKYRENLSEAEYEHIRGEVLKDIDFFMGNLINTIDLDESLLIITSPNNGDGSTDNSRLSPIVILGKDMKKGTLMSSTTNRENIVSNMDIGPTIMDFLGASRDNMSGKSINKIDKQSSLEDMIKENKQINTTSKVRYKTLLYYGVISIFILTMPLILLMAKIRASYRTKEITNLLLTMLLVAPNIFIISSVLKPVNIKSYITILFGLILLSIIFVWKTRKYNNQLLYISGFTIVLIFLDLLFKGGISMYSVLSHDPIIGARYYGIGNEMVGLLLGAVSVFSIKILEKRKKSLIPAIILIISVVLVGNPSMGANVGGTLAFIMAMVIYLIELSKIKISYKKILIIGILITFLIALMGYIDIRINENTTHLGNSILLIKDNGLNDLMDIVLRKVLMNIKLIGTSFWTYLLLIHMFSHLIIFSFSKEMNKNSLKATIAGVGGAMAGFLLNDSGIILAAICMNIITLEIYIKDI